jgi:all-trans-retinol 13,14-reductase
VPAFDNDFDDLVIGAGMAGLTTAALLAQRGRRVLVLEAHDAPGGYAHTFSMGEYRFCAQVHYIFNCGEGEPVYELLRRLGLHESVRFVRLDPEGYDHVVVAGERYRIPNGLEKYRDRLVQRFPNDAPPIRAYFEAVQAIGGELDALPRAPSWRDFLAAPLRFPHLLRYQHWTLQRLYDRLRMPPRLQTLLAGQAGDYLLPPKDVSLLLHVALVRGYDRGAYYPEKHYQHFIGSIAGAITSRRGCNLLLESEVERILIEGDRAVGVRTKRGEVFTAERYVSNIDPQRTAGLIEPRHLPRPYRKRLCYAYSGSTVTLYLGIRGLDLRDYGFGSFNVWHYPKDDLNDLYRRQESGDLGDPWLFMSTPTLHTNEPGICPQGTQILEIATSAPHERFRRLRDAAPKKYAAEKKQIRDRILTIVEERYVPNLSRHVVRRITGTPTTNERYCWAPEGNAYGAALTPANMNRTLRSFETPFRNLWQVNATAGYPSIAGTVGAAMSLVDDVLER